MTPMFRIAGNPDEDSTLPYLLSVPLGSTPLVLKAKEACGRGPLGRRGPHHLRHAVDGRGDARRSPVRYPNAPIAFCENQQLAQEWAYRFLGAAAAYADEEAIDLG